MNVSPPSEATVWGERSSPQTPLGVFAPRRKDMVLTPMGLRFLGRRFPCSVGRGGILVGKREGDGATPVGVHRITGVLFRPDRMVCPVKWAQPIQLGDLWCDDPGRPEYNTLVQWPFSGSHEVLRRADPLYDLVILTDWNWPKAVPGMGSAIFLHRWRRPGAPTEGCVAFRPDHLRWIVRRITPDTRLVVCPQA